MYNIHVTVSYLVYKLVLNRHGDHSDNQYKCTDCHCTMDNVVSRGILELCVCIIISSGCTMLGLLRLFITTTHKKIQQTLILVATTLPIVIFSIFTEC